ncbi:MAG: hypothetical protein WD851_18190 [Pirellulales bacterium]
MNHFKLFAHGEEFDVDAFLAVTPLTIDRTWRRGDLRGHPEFIQDRHPTSGVEICLGPGRTLSDGEQDRIAAAFLEVNEDALKALAQFPGVTIFILGLHHYVELMPNVVGFCMSPSARLMYFALRVGLTPTFYVDLDRKDFDDEVS